jgi:hypothetical protein
MFHNEWLNEFFLNETIESNQHFDIDVDIQSIDFELNWGWKERNAFGV